MNLMMNARDAMGGSGVLTVEARAVELDASFTVGPSFEVGAGAYVQIAVSDTGHGMEPDVLDRVFEPFFTTKRDRGGTGLGLASSHGLVRQAGGAISAYSEPGRGTTFRVYLPVAKGAVLAPSSGAADPVRGGAERLLVVDNDAGIVAIAVRALVAQGYDVHTAASGAEASSRVEAGLAPDLILSDLMMPGLSGVELVARIRAIRPTVGALFMSGYTALALHSHAQAFEVVEKPFRTDELARRVRATLDARIGPERG